MKSMAELEAIRKKTLARINLRREDASKLVRVVVGMGTCGIAAGARDVVLAFMEEADKRAMSNVTIAQTGCMGQCQLEPMVEVFVHGQDKVTYVHVTPEKARRIMEEHIFYGNPVQDYTIGAAEH